jgi:hypothetical protein
VIEFERLVIKGREQRIGKTHRLDTECRVGSPVVFDDDLGHETLDERVADAAIDRGDEIQPVRRQSRRQVRHIDDASPTQTTRRRIRRDHLAIRRDVGAADLVHAGLDVDRADQVTDHVGRGDWLDRGANPAWADHERKPLGEVPQHLERDAASPEDDRCSELDNGNIARRECGADFLAAHEMLRLWVMPKPTEVDDASKTRS